MMIFSNAWIFPVMQVALLALAAFAIYRDCFPSSTNTSGDRVDAIVVRGPATMGTLEKITGLAVAAIITIINKSVFDDDESGWQHYSAIFNFVDLAAIVYLFYFSSWTRNNLILRLWARAQRD
jgi:ABC-type transport system involved in multi-copper enzyme maturation permease subunit